MGPHPPQRGSEREDPRRVRVGLWSAAPPPLLWLPVSRYPPHASRNAVNALLTLSLSNMIGYTCSRRNSEEGRIAVVLGYVLASPTRRREPVAPGSPSKPIPSQSYRSRDGSIKDRLFRLSPVSMPRDRQYLHAFSRHSILTAPPQPISSLFLAPGCSRAPIHSSLEGSLACSHARKSSKSSLPISMGRTAKLKMSLTANHVACKRHGPLAVTGRSGSLEGWTPSPAPWSRRTR